MTEGIASLQRHVERLFLLVLLHPASDAAGGSAESARGVAFLAMLFSLVWAVRALCLLRRCVFDSRVPTPAPSPCCAPWSGR